MTSPYLSGSEELRRMIGDVDDATIAKIIDLHPTLSDVEQALMWLNAEGDIPDRQGHPLEGNAAIIFDLLKPEEEEERRPD
jgi:hypothetical protein